VDLKAKAVTALELPAGKTDHIVWDDAMPGFGYRLRAGAGGKMLRSWIVQYKRAGATRRMLLGNAAVLGAEQARLAAKKALAAVALGQDPQADRIDRRHRDRHSLKSVVDQYLAAKKPDVRARTYVEAQRYLSSGRYLRPLHSLPIDTITRADVASRILAIAREAGNVTAAHARSNLNAIYVWAMQMGLTDTNPVIGSVQPKASEGRTRVLTDAELASVWRACSDEHDHYARIVRLLILTACRRQEVGGMCWSELDAEQGVWTIPAARSKNKRQHTLPLPAAAWAIIGTVPHVAGRDYLFGERGMAGFGNWGDCRAALADRLGDSVAPFVLHDIRRTIATKMADLGVQPHIIEEVLGHARSGHKRGIAGIYNRAVYMREVKAALELWATHVALPSP
jgi:integrase